MLPVSWNFDTIKKRFRSFDDKNLGSEGQWALKLLAVKVGLLKKKSAFSAIPAEVCASAIGLGSRTPGVKSFSKFDGQQLCSPLTNRPQIFSIERSKPLFKIWHRFKGLVVFLAYVLPSQSDFILHHKKVYCKHSCISTACSYYTILKYYNALQCIILV